jgi:hypothetical protein
MQISLISALVRKNALATDTIVIADYNSTDVFGRVFSKLGEFKIRNIVLESEEPIFELQLGDETKKIVKSNGSNIKSIEGMDPVRYADIYDLLPDGSNKKVGRKRGRKPKQTLNT